MNALAFFILLFGASVLQAQELYQFDMLRQGDKLELDSSAAEGSWYDKIKSIGLSETAVLSIGGSYRGQYEYFKNEEFSFSPNEENGWYLQRLLLHTHVQVNERLRFFGELGSSLISGKEELVPVDRDELYLNQLFGEYSAGNVTITVGRENLRLGSQRLVAPREGPNVRWSFDHLSMNVKKGNADILMFVSSPVFVQPGSFDNRNFHEDEYLWGLYGERILTGASNLDVYYLGSHYTSSTYALGAAEEYRHSLGGRHWRQTGSWMYDNEAILQLGSFGSSNILAWTVSFNIKRQLNQKNQLCLKTEIISGSTSEESLGTFNPLYPRGAYFGRVARFGPSNLIDLHPYWTYRHGKFTMEIDYDIFWRYSRTDAVYDPAMNIVLDGSSERRFLAHQFGTIFNYEFSPFAIIELETNLILPGTYLEEIDMEARNLFHAVMTVEMIF